MIDILSLILSFLVGVSTANLYRRAVANDTADVLADVSQEMADLMAENARLQAELAELRRGLDALGRVDLGG